MVVTYSEAHASSTDFSPPRKETPSAAAWACLLAAVGISLVFSWHYLPFVSDDALIAYRYSDRLLHGHGLTWTDGEFVEGYSNLLWVLLVAAGGLIQPNLVLVGWSLGLLANVATLTAVAWTFHESSRTALLPVAVGLLTLSLSAWFAVWGVGGLETALFTALVAWALGTCYRTPLVGKGWMSPAFLLGLLSITRPDGILFGISIPLALIARDGYSRAAIQQALKLLLAPVCFTMAQIGFRVVYYRSLVPNTAYVKIAFTIDRVLNGGVYVAWGALVNCVPITIIMAALFLLYRGRSWHAMREALIFLVPGAVWLSYLIIIGGDIWPANRHWLPTLVCFVFALTSLLPSTLKAAPPRRAALVLSVASVLHFTLAAATLNIFPAFEEGHLQVSREPLVSSLTEQEFTCIPVGQSLHRAFSAQRPLLAVHMAGCLPLETGFPSLDMLGLNDFYIAHHRPADMGRGSLAHELGDGRYVLSRKPDIIEMGTRNGEPVPAYRGDLEIVEALDFKRLYRLVYFGVGASMWSLWVRAEDGRVGIVRSGDGIYIPGFLLASKLGTRARLDHSGTLVTALENGDAVVKDVILPVGTWDISLVADAPNNMQLAISPSADSEQLQARVWRVVSDGKARSFRVFGGHGLIYAITAKRVAGPPVG